MGDKSLATLFFGLLLFVPVLSICQVPDVPKNGYYSPDKINYSMGDKVMFYCNPGFTLLGDSSRVCQASGRWNGSTPFCDKPTKISMPSWTSDKMVDGDTATCHPIIHGMTFSMAEPGIVQAVTVHIPRQASTKLAVFTVQNKTVRSCADYQTKTDTEEWITLKCDNTLNAADKIRIMHLGNGEDRVDICETSAYAKTGEWCEHPPNMVVRDGYFEVSRDQAILHCPMEQKNEVSSLVCINNSWIGSNIYCRIAAEKQIATPLIKQDLATTDKLLLIAEKDAVDPQNFQLLQSKVNTLVAIVTLLTLGLLGLVLYELWKRRGQISKKPNWVRMASDNDQD